ncbi:MAG TPA: hypothetical protein VGE52_14165 [Pirellulales bacterium]
MATKFGSVMRWLIFVGGVLGAVGCHGGPWNKESKSARATDGHALESPDETLKRLQRENPIMYPASVKIPDELPANALRLEKDGTPATVRPADRYTYGHSRGWGKMLSHLANGDDENVAAITFVRPLLDTNETWTLQGMTDGFNECRERAVRLQQQHGLTKLRAWAREALDYGPS